MNETCHVIIPAAGVGKRFGGGGRKQFITLDGHTLLERCLKVFRACSFVDRIVACLPADDLNSFRGSAKNFRAECVPGGKTRAESVFLGFQFLNPKGGEAILIHDAARPLVSTGLVSRMTTALKTSDAAVPVLPVADTVKRMGDGNVIETIDRKELGLTQTPQAFRASILRSAYDKAGTKWDWTDEAMLVERMGGRVKGVEGEKQNIKITTSEDLKLAELYLRGIGEGSP